MHFLDWIELNFSYNKNNSGPRIEPSETPHIIASSSEVFPSCGWKTYAVRLSEPKC